MRTIHLLGPPAVQGAAGGIDRALPRARLAVLAVLALSKTRSATRERVMALLWPESNQAKARHLLRDALYRLRPTLGEECLHSSGDEIRLDQTCLRCDVWEFEDAVARGEWLEADRLYGGPLLDGFFLADAPEFEQWVDGERARLQAMHREALERAASDASARADCLAAAKFWRRAAEADPYNSRIALGLMTALVAIGDRAGALKHSASYSTLLRKDLDAEPDSSVVAFAEQLRRRSSRDSARLTAVAPPPNPSADVLRVTAPASRPADRSEANLALPSVNTTGRRRLWGSVFTTSLLVLTLVAGFVRARGATPTDSDANRIVVIPFRTVGADSSLGFMKAGIVELLSTRFTGQYGPSAVDAGEVLRAWNRGGSDRPITQEAARAFARELHAGQALYGSVVGTPTQITISASVVETATGIARVPSIEVRGSLDSLSALLGQLSAKLLARYAGVEPVYQTRPDVLDAFLQGMVEYRHGNWVSAGRLLFHALELDSTFTPAAYRFALVHAHTAPRTPFGDLPTRDPRFTRLYESLWSQRQHLSPEHRRLLEAVADSLYVRWPTQSLPRLERVVQLAPHSVEAWDILGDDYYHAGAVLGRENWRSLASHALHSAQDLDLTVAMNAAIHLPDLAFIDRNLDAFDAAAAAGARQRGAYRQYQRAILRDEAGELRAARAAYASAWARGDEDGIDWAFSGLTIPHAELDSVIAAMERVATTAEQRRSVADWKLAASLNEGRVAQWPALLQLAHGADSVGATRLLMEFMRNPPGSENRLLGQGPPPPNNQRHPDECNVALTRLRRGDSSGVSAILTSEPAMNDSLPASEVVGTVRRGVKAQAAICGQVLRGVLAGHRGTDDRWLWRADSIMRNLQLNYGAQWNYDLGVALARRGFYREAAAAARRRFVDRGAVPWLVASLRDEGRWAATAGDTASAVSAYRHYLMWRDTPDSALVPQRDSVRRELARLVR